VSVYTFLTHVIFLQPPYHASWTTLGKHYYYTFNIDKHCSGKTVTHVYLPYVQIRVHRWYHRPTNRTTCQQPTWHSAFWIH